jgi:hypothetical protein
VATPRVDSVSATVYRGRPSDDEEFDVPVAVSPDKPLALKHDQVIGGVAGNGDSAAISYDGKAKLFDTTTNVHLEVTKLGAGSYDGTIDLAPDADSGDVAVKMTVKDWWPYAVLALVLGIVLALFIQRLTGVSLPKRKLLVGVDETTSLYAKKKCALTETAAGKPWAGYGISDLAENQQTLKTKIKRQTRPYLLAIAQKVLDGLEPDLRALILQIENVGDVDAKMRQLEQAVDAVATYTPSAALPPLELANGAEPELTTNARDYLTGVELTAKALDTRLADVDAATVAAGQLYVYAQLVSDYRTRALALMHNSNEQQKAEIQPILDQLHATWLKLSRTPDTKSFDVLAAGVELDKINDEIAMADAHLHPEGDRAPLAAGVGGLRTLGLTSRPAAFIDRPAEHAAEDEHPAKTAMWGGYAVAVVALVVAVITGLSTLYIGKPFGTTWDYILAITWGLTTQAALAILSSTLNGFGGLQGVAQRLR